MKLPFEKGNGNIRSLRKDKQGNYYLITSIGVTKVNSKFQIVQKYVTAVKDIFFREDDSVYIARINGVSLVHQNDFEKQSNKLDYFFFSKLRYKHPTNYFVGGKELGIFCVGNDGIKVIKNNSITDFGEKDEFKKNISDVVRTPKNIICIGSSIKGIKVVYKNKDYYIDNKSGLTSNFITSLALDSKQNLWAGSANGLFKISFIWAPYRAITSSLFVLCYFCRTAGSSQKKRSLLVAQTLSKALNKAFRSIPGAALGFSL
ncbi:MAG: two-component regulator propeller domain-containing protein, partial [Bacteroidota bacterium]|nr:two-component regulator propeller domain-containing protein [Bacteroidota bacterium]